MPTKENNQFQIAVPSEVEDGVYSNFAVITHSTAEFVLDFIRILPNGGSPKVKARVVMAPEHAKRLMLALNDNISKYEKMNGAIDLRDPRSNNVYQGPHGEA